MNTHISNPAQEQNTTPLNPSEAKNINRRSFLVLGAVILNACKSKTITPDKPVDTIDRTTDNPAHFKDFENTIKKRELTAGGITFAEQKFNIHWDNVNKKYVLETKPILYADPCITQVEQDAQQFGHDVSKCYVFYSFTNNGNLRRAWGMPYNVLVENKGKGLDLNSEKFNKYLTNSSLNQGHPATTYVKKLESGYLSIGTSAPDWSDMSIILTIAPYIIGR